MWNSYARPASRDKTTHHRQPQPRGAHPDDIDSQAPLFGDGLGLDSIDALELGLAIKGRYGIVLSAEDENTRRHFASVAALVALVQAQSKGEA